METRPGRGSGGVLSDGGTPSEWDERYIKQPFEENGSTSSMDIDIVDLSSADRNTSGKEVFDGMVQGFRLLRDELQDVDGFRVRLYDLDAEFSGKNSWSNLNSVLTDHGFDESKHYHVIYDGELLPKKIGSYHNTKTSDGTMWHDQDVKGISGLSLSTTRFTLSNVYTRGLHQTMHNYISEDIVLERADTSNGYDAVHQLGTSTSDARTIMADTYPHRTFQGECNSPDCIFFCRPNAQTLAFSDCTLTAIRKSIRANQS